MRPNIKRRNTRTPAKKTNQSYFYLITSWLNDFCDKLLQMEMLKN